MVVRGRKASRDASPVLDADDVLRYKENIPLPVIEAKKSVKDATAVMQQAIECAALLDVPFCFFNNGQSFAFRDAKLKRYGGQGPERHSVPIYTSPEQHRIVTRVTE